MSITPKHYQNLTHKIILSTSKDIFFISDIHLNPRLPAVENTWLAFMAHVQEEKPDALFILGDLLDAWISPKHANAKWLSQFKQSIASIAQHTTTYFLPGNRDCLLTSDDCHTLGMQFLNDPSIITINGKDHLITHGDLLCTHDKKHILFRNILLKKSVNIIIRSIPTAIINVLIALIKKISKRHKATLSLPEQNINLKLLDKICLEISPAFVLHGHTHKIEKESLQSSKAIRINLGFWAPNSFQYWSLHEQVHKQIDAEIETAGA